MDVVHGGISRLVQEVQDGPNLLLGQLRVEQQAAVVADVVVQALILAIVAGCIQSHLEPGILKARHSLQGGLEAIVVPDVLPANGGLAGQEQVGVVVPRDQSELRGEQAFLIQLLQPLDHLGVGLGELIPDDAGAVLGVHRVAGTVAKGAQEEIVERRQRRRDGHHVVVLLAVAEVLLVLAQRRRNAHAHLLKDVAAHKHGAVVLAAGTRDAVVTAVDGGIVPCGLRQIGEILVLGNQVGQVVEHALFDRIDDDGIRHADGLDDVRQLARGAEQADLFGHFVARGPLNIVINIVVVFHPLPEVAVLLRRGAVQRGETGDVERFFFCHSADAADHTEGQRDCQEQSQHGFLHK